MKLTIKMKIILCIVLAAAITSSTAIYTLIRYNEAAAKYLNLTDNVNVANVAASEVVTGVFRQLAAVRGYIVSKDVDKIQDFYDAQEYTMQKLVEFESNIANQEHQIYVDQLTELNNEYGQIAESSFFAIQRGDQLAVAEIIGQGNDIAKAAEKVSYELNGIYKQITAEESEAAKQIANDAKRNGVLILLVALVLSLVVGYMISNNLTLPVLHAINQARYLAAGDLTIKPLQVTTKDELGELATSFNLMLRNIKEFVVGINSAASSVYTAAQELNTTSQQSAQAAESAATVVQQLAAGASDQAHASENIRITMEQLQQTIQQIASGSQQTAGEVQQSLGLLNHMVNAIENMAADAESAGENAGKVVDTARNGVDVVNSTVMGMVRIKEQVGNSAERIGILEQLSAQIGNITDTISGISDQTNLLALNAAIEAARAGEHGRGFAVVAEEVRKLAERSDASAREIAELISNIQSRTNEAVKAMEAGTLEIEKGSVLAEEAGKSLNEISTMAERAANSVQSISQETQLVQENAQQVVKAFDSVAAVTEESTAGTEEMAAASGEVNNSMEQVAPVAQANAAMAQELSSSIEQLSASSGAVSDAAINLSDIAKNVLQLVAQFKVEGGH